MTFKATYVPALAACLLVACGRDAPAPDPGPAPVPDLGPAQVTAPVAAAANPLLADVATATYTLEPTHASLIWKISHNGLSNYTARFTDLSASLSFNAQDPARSTLTARINPLSIRTDNPDGPDWDTALRTDEKWFNAAAFPAITYVSANVTLTGENTGIITGDLSLLGITRQVPLTVTFNGARNFAWWGERDVIGFSATAVLKRSDFGMIALLPDIGDEVTITIEAEFLQDE